MEAFEALENLLMKREFTKTVVEKHFEVICDVCGYSQIDSWRGFGKCEFCDKHVCWKHFAYSEDESGDYPRYKRACPEHEEKLKEIVEKYQELCNYPDLDELIEKAISGGR